jgi:hypothetical protein
MKTKFKKITYHNLGLNNKIEKKFKFYQSSKNKNYKSKE